METIRKLKEEKEEYMINKMATMVEN